MKRAKRQTIHLIGAGLSGSLLAVFLARLGFQVEIFEKRGDPRIRDPLAGRSINLALARRGIQALEQVGLADEVARHMLPMAGRMVHPLSGEAEFFPYGNRPEEVIYSIHRGKLNKLLVEAADASPQVTLHFNQRLKSISFTRNHMRLQGPDGKIRKHRTAGPILGVDGAGSKVRRALERIEHFKSDVQLLDHGYKELTTHAGAGGRFQLRQDALHIWPRGEFMMIALPNTDGTFTNTLFMPKQGEDSFEVIKQPEAAAAFVNEAFSDAVPLMPDALTELKHNPTGVLGTVRTPQWFHRHKALILGDAAHAIVPFHGQGMNCCFEDCAALAHLLESQAPTSPAHWESLFAEFQDQRIDNANAIADMALENYVEMRAKVTDPAFKLRRKLAQALERRHPRQFIPRYSLVMFHTVPYAEALRRGLDQQDILEELTYGKSTLSEIDWRYADQLVERELNR